jgi:ATP-dependent RNA helicase RhlE
LMFSATMPPKINELAKRILNQPQEIRLAVSKPAEKIDQQFYMANDQQKMPLLVHLLKKDNPPSMVLFTSRKSTVDSIVRSLRRQGFDAHGISSDSEQNAREEVLRNFKNKQFSILVATDVLSRGIDIDNLSHVVNYDVPHDPEDYVHRIGRTARAESTGTAITLINEADQHKVARIERLLEKEVEKLSITEELGLGPAPIYSSRKARPSSGGNRSGKPKSSSNGKPQEKRRYPRKKKTNSGDPAPTL